MCFYSIFFDKALFFKPTLNALKNLSTIVASVRLQTNSYMPTHPDRHTPNGAVVSYSTLVVFLPAFLNIRGWSYHSRLPGRVGQSVTYLATDACLTADSGVASSILVRFHTFVEIDHEIISTVILLPSADLFKKGCCQLQAKVYARITG